MRTASLRVTHGLEGVRMIRRTFLILLAVLIAIASGLAGYFYGIHRSDRLLNDLEYLNQASKILLELQTIQLANAGNVNAIKSTQERLIRLNVISLKNYGIDSDGANKPIILESLVKLKDYQLKTSGKVDPDLNALLERLQ